MNNGPNPRQMIIFAITCIAIIAGYGFIQDRFFPPPKPVPPHLKKRPEDVVGLVGDAATRADGLAAISRLAISDRIQQPEGRKQFAELALAEAKAKPAPKPVAPKPAVAKAEPKLIDLGNDSFYLRVRLTTRGAGVDRVIVSNFDQADKNGLPVKDANGRNVPLHLISSPHDMSPGARAEHSLEELAPSFLMYHYADPGAARPENELGEANWNLVASPADNSSEHQEATFSYNLTALGLRVLKIFSLDRRQYHVGLTVRIERIPGGVSPPPLFRYQIAGGHGLPIEGEWYTSTFRNAIFGWLENGKTARRQLEDNVVIQRELGGQRLTRGQNTEFQYAACVVQYFASALCVDDQQERRNFIEFARAIAIDPNLKAQPLLKDKLQLRDIAPRFISEGLDVSERPIEHKYLLYHGPIKVRLLNQMRGDQAVDSSLVDRYENTLNLRTMTDYRSDSWIGRFANFIFWTDVVIAFTNLMHTVLGYLSYLIPVYGLAILILTVMVRGMLYPISRRQQANMAKMQERMQKMQPELKRLEEQYKGRDSQELHQAKMKYMMEHGVNPMAQLGGCLLMFAQMPVFMGLYYCLQENVFFRLQSVTPWWIPNLAAPDMLFWWTDKIPYISTWDSLGNTFYLGPYFNLLPVIAVALMWMQQKLFTPPAVDEQQRMQQSMFKYMMIFFGFMFYKVPAGLCIYFIASSLWGLAERKLLPKKQISDEPPSMPGKGGKGGRGKGVPPPKPQPKGGLGRMFDSIGDAWKKLLEAAEKK